MMDAYTAIALIGLILGLIGIFVIEVLVPRKKKALQRAGAN